MDLARVGGNDFWSVVDRGLDEGGVDKGGGGLEGGGEGSLALREVHLLSSASLT